MIDNLQNILAQPTLATADPIYVVYSKQEICVDSDFDYDKIVYIRKNCGNYEELDYDAFQNLETQYYSAHDYRSIKLDSNGEQIIDNAPKDPFNDEEEFDPDDWEPRYIKYIDKFEQAFFIRQNAQDFIDRNSHNLGRDAYIYVESAWRNPEWQAIREMLVDKATVEGNDVSV